MSDSSNLDRRSFFGLAAATGAVVATGAALVGCQSDATPSPVPGEAPKPTTADELAVAPVRRAIVPDDVAPAFTFQPIGRRAP